VGEPGARSPRAAQRNAGCRGSGHPGFRYAPSGRSCFLVDSFGLGFDEN